MSRLNKFCERIILILASASILCIPIVFCGCRRTNPEWLSSDIDEEHLSAPIISHLPGKYLSSNATTFEPLKNFIYK